MSIINPENIKDTSLPLETESFALLMSNKEIVFNVDLTQSKLKSHKANIAYLANANIPAIIDVNKMDKEDLKGLLNEWMNTLNVVDISPLPNIAAKVILNALGIDNTIPVPAIVTDEWLSEYVEENRELITMWMSFIDSSYTIFAEEFGGKTFEELQDRVYEGPYEIIDDRGVIGKSVVLLFGVKDFGTYYLTVPFGNVFYWKAQFEEYLFKNKPLAAYFNHPNNTAQIMMGILKEVINEMDLAEVNDMMTEAMSAQEQDNG